VQGASLKEQIIEGTEVRWFFRESGGGKGKRKIFVVEEIKNLWITEHWA